MMEGPKYFTWVISVDIYHVGNGNFEIENIKLSVYFKQDTNRMLTDIIFYRKVMFSAKN